MNLINHKCLRYNRELKSKESIKLGYGPTYYRIMQLQPTEKPISDIEFLKMEVKMLKKIVRDLTKNGIVKVDAIERIKNDTKP